MYKTLEVLGPEHEFSIVGQDLGPLPIVDKVIRKLHGRIVNQVSLDGSSFGKELQTHVAEIKANAPFSSPRTFEDTIQNSVDKIEKLLDADFDAMLLGTGMHPFLIPKEAGIWSHRHHQIYAALGKVFDLRQHGWLNIQSFQLNLPYGTEEDGVKLHNTIANLLPYLPAIAASSPIYESKVGRYVDNRLHFYSLNQKEIPSIAGEIIPEYVSSFPEYHDRVIGRYSEDLRRVKAPDCLLEKEWMNSRGEIFRFDRDAIEIRVMDEQECIKVDVALSCFIRCILRAWMSESVSLRPHEQLVKDLWSITSDGLCAKVNYPRASTARDVCFDFLEIAKEAATPEEKGYLGIIEHRIADGSLADLILRDIVGSAGVRNFNNAVLEIYRSLAKCLRDNMPYS